MMSADSGDFTVLVLLDLTSAFDTVDHNNLINRLRDVVGISDLAWRWFHSSFFWQNLQCLWKSGHVRTYKPKVWGTSGFSPRTYPVPFIHFTFRTDNPAVPWHLYHLYADDVQLYCSFKPNDYHKLSSLMKCLASIKQWVCNNYLQLNAEKTETLIAASTAASLTLRNTLVN